MKRSDFRFLDRLRVRWMEVDMQKIVFNAHYLTYISTAVTGYWRAMALPYEQTLDHLGGEMFVRKATLEYESPARYDDQLDVGIRCSRIGTSSVVCTAGLFRGEELLVRGEMVYVYAGTPVSPSAPTPVPQELREALQAFEAGKPMVDVRVGSWAELGRDAGGIRTAVFIEEQKIPAELEWDEADAGCTHAVAYNRIGMPLATGRLLEHVPGVAKIGRMAVSPSVRGGGVGRTVLEALMKAARERGDHEAVLHAQISAVPFYVRAGFMQRGPVFDEAGIPHVEMVRGI